MDTIRKTREQIAEITRILLEMRDNCTKGTQYDDPQRWAKFDALSDAVDLINSPMRMDGRESLNTLRDAIYADAVAHGLWDISDEMRSYSAYYGSDESIAIRLICAAKIKAECLEMAQARRDDEYAEELADVVIMSLSVAGKLGIDIDAAVRRKMEINKNRPWKHGRE